MMNEGLKRFIERRRDNAAFRCHAHYAAQRRTHGAHLGVGVPACVLSVVATATIFATMWGPVSRVFQLVVALASLCAAVLVNVGAFLRFAETSERHNIASTRYERIAGKFELLLASLESDAAIQAKADEFAAEMDAVRAAAPPMRDDDVRNSVMPGQPIPKQATQKASWMGLGGPPSERSREKPVLPASPQVPVPPPPSPVEAVSPLSRSADPSRRRIQPGEGPRPPVKDMEWDDDD